MSTMVELKLKAPPSHNLIFKKSEEERLDELFRTKCH